MNKRIGIALKNVLYALTMATIGWIMALIIIAKYP